MQLLLDADLANAHRHRVTAYGVMAMRRSLSPRRTATCGNRLHRVKAFYRFGLRMILPAYVASKLNGDGALNRTGSG